MGVYRHILVGVDGSDASAQAADMAGRLAADLDAKLTVVFVRQLPAVPVSSFGVPMNVDSYWEDQERLAWHRLLLGSVSTRLLHHARRQVLVVR